MQLTGFSQGSDPDDLRCTYLPRVVFLEACNLLDKAIRRKHCMECFHIHRVCLVLYLHGHSRCLNSIVCPRNVVQYASTISADVNAGNNAYLPSVYTSIQISCVW